MGGSVRSSLGICARRRCVTSGLLRLAPLHLKTHAQTFTLRSLDKKLTFVHGFSALNAFGRLSRTAPTPAAHDLISSSLMTQEDGGSKG